MRTRSQQQSPGNFVSLENPSRRTRSTRSASQTKTANTTNATDRTDTDPTEEEPSGPSKQPATRAKSQRVTKKKTATTTKNKVTKAASSKPAAKATRKSTRKTTKATSEEPETHADETPETTPETDENKENADDAIQNTESESATAEQALAEKNDAQINRKRTRSVVSDEETAAGGPETPIANKRRNLGAPGSTPFARRLPPLSRRLSSTSVPYSERLRRRQAERNGRIHRTVFRLPEYIAQEMADRQAAETASQPEPPLTHVDGSEDPERSQGQDQQVEVAPAEPSSEQPSAPSAALPSALPETPRRGWNIRGLLNSVPRSFSRLIPGFGRPSAQNGQPEQSLSSSDSETTKQSASGIDRTVDAEPEFTTTKAKFRPWKPRRRLTTGEPPQKRRNLEYSLFPAPMDRSLYLGDITTPLRDLPEPSTLQSASLPSTSHPSTVDTRPHEPTITATSVISESSAQIEDASSATQAQETRGRETPQQASSNKQKKRKRAPSPDVIPNPPGCSYGMDTDYFWYSSESEDEGEDEAAEQSTALQQANGLARTAVRSALRSDRPASKKVRFDASPEDTPSKLRTRARATDPYTGSHFIGMGSGSPSSPTPNASSPAPFVEEEEGDLYGPSPVVDPRTRPGFIPNTQGTFQLDYDAFSDDDSSESSEPSSPTSASAPSSAPAAETPLDESPQSPATSTAPSVAPAATPRQASIMPPSTPAATVDDEALAKVRSLAEKHKPKTPSRLRTASRYSSPMTITPDARIESAPVEDFGDDEFAQDAQWLYEHCPSGDLTKFQWPDRQGYQESLEISQTAIDILAKVWNDSEADEAHNLFCQGFEEFKQQA